MPLYLNAAAATNDHIERFKLVICSAVGYLYADKYFEKPLESILGETLQGYGQDGSSFFVEQTNAEPPRMHYLYEGPNTNY